MWFTKIDTFIENYRYILRLGNLYSNEDQAKIIGKESIYKIGVIQSK